MENLIKYIINEDVHELKVLFAKSEEYDKVLYYIFIEISVIFPM